MNKKTNTLGVVLGTDEYIDVKEIWYFEKFLMERFNFGNIDTQIKYIDNTEIKDIKSEWKNIIAYMAHKYPLAKPMLLINADVEVEDNKINVKMHIKGADFLRAKKSDKVLETLIKNIMGKDYKISLNEELDQAEIKRIEESAKKEEEKVVSHAIEQIESAKHIDPDYIPPQDEDMPYIPEEGEEKINYVPEMMENGELHNSEEMLDSSIEEQILILGKQTKAKENKVKIKAIIPSDARITLEGRVSNVEKRLTKSEKVLLIFDLFDGTGSITCKSFTIPDDAESIISKLEEANTVKLIGKANIDAYAGDVIQYIKQIIIQFLRRKIS